jgi:ThiF family
MPATTFVKVVGCGGIGAALLPILCRSLNFSSDRYPTVEVTLIDGDYFEPRNSKRQVCLSATNKAEGIAEIMAAEFPRIYFRAIPAFLTGDNVEILIVERDIIFSCVDNHASRKLLNDRCCTLNQVVTISGGNDYTDGSIQVHVREGGIDRTLPIASPYHPEILHPADENPGTKSTRHLVEPRPELIMTNNFVAAAMLNCFYAQQHGKLDYDVVYLDVISNQSRSVRRTKRNQDAKP